MSSSLQKIFFILCIVVGGAGLAGAASTTEKPGVMRYRMATVDEKTWIDPQQEAEVAGDIDRILAAGCNAISIGTYKFMPIYFVDYSHTKYPEAREYDAAAVAANVATLRKNMQLAKSKGIGIIVSRSYSHYAPYKFWKAHQPELNPGGLFDSLLSRAHQSEIYERTIKGKDNIIPQQQWANPVFKQFFLDSTALMLDALPELDGFLNAYAEAAWSYDLEKIKANTWKGWKDAVDFAATDDNFVDYANSLYHLLEQKRGDKLFFGMRDWYVKPEVLQRLSIPRDKLVISVKYAGFDQPLINYPPWGKDLLDAGYGVVLDMLVYDAEHPHPLYWYDPDIIFPTFANIRAGGFSGVTYQDFSVKGEDSATNPIRLLTQRTVGAAMKGEPFTTEDAVKFLQPYYGDGARDLLVSLKMVSEAQAELIKLCPAWFWQGDGLTAGGLTTLHFWQLMDNPDAPTRMGFVRQDVVGVKEYVAAKLNGGDALQRAEDAWHKTGKKTPPDVIRFMQSCADEAIAAVERARTKSPANAPYLQDIVASAVIHRQLVLRDSAFLKAALAFYESGGQYDGKYNDDKELKPSPLDRKAECVTELRSAIGHDEILRQLCLEYAPRRRATRSKNDYSFESHVAAIVGQKLTAPPIDDHELGEMRALITGAKVQ